MARRKNTFPLHLERMMADLYASALRRMAKNVMREIKSTYKAEHHNTPAAVLIKADESFKEMVARLTQEYTDYLTSKNMLYKVKRAEMALRSWSFRTVSDSMTAIKDLKKRDYAMLAIEQAIDSPFIKAVSDNFVKTNMEMLEAAGKEYISGISEAAMNTFINGGSMKDLVREMTEYTGGDIAKAEFWAQDQMGDAYTAYTDELHSEAGLDNFVWRTCGDNAVRESHAELEGRVFSRARGVPEGTLSKPGAKLPGQDYRCLTGDTNIIFDSNIVRCYRRWYSGELTIITTDTGKTIRVTPNHPILSGGEWKPANKINLGDNLVQVSDEFISSCKQNINYGKITAEEIFNFFSLHFPLERVAGFTSQFHGDGTHEEVDIISAHGRLPLKRYISMGEFINKLLFTLTNKMIPRFVVSCFRNLFNGFLIYFFAPHRVMGGFSKSKFFIFRKFSHSNNVGLRSRPGYYSGRYYSTSDPGPCNSIFFRTRKFTHSRPVIISKGLLVNNLVSARVISVKVSFFHGYLYNFETENNMYYANQLSSHNCRCTMEPTLDEPDA